MMKRVFYNYKTWDFDVIYHNIVWNSENVLSGMTWTFQDLTFKKLGNQISYWYLFRMYISCHSRNGVYLQCHCQIKPKTVWRYNDAEPRASMIPFSSKTHTNHRFLLWGLPEECLPLGFSSPIQENPGTSWDKQGVCHWKFSCAWPNTAPFPE